ncbi:DUF3010 family protein [Shewanella sp. Isolate11]|uniref:DUF3010 family protein n=1 Tax=Shewanella sp. Isolate11 TaxID=2908530 RepID=UPI001EFC93F3|nr:DUF3010 family protein [Shewanella sp. Isolate11]MCG9697575.1 DUF3010 family protein [Shewanella sp. Isolate11]
MAITGVFLKGYEARLISLCGSRAEHQLVATKVNKIAIPKSPSVEDIQQFNLAFAEYCQQQGTEQLVINRRATTGKGAGGAGSFILEGVLLASSQWPISFVHPATLRATDNKYAELKNYRPATQDLGKAYDLAFELL